MVDEQLSTRARVTSTVERGASAESTAAALLVRAGYRIVARNFRCKAGELDIIAHDGDVLVFVEVRSRIDASHGHAAEMIGPRKRRQVSRVAAYYVATHATSSPIRFDVVAITAGSPMLIRDAWRV